MLQWNFNNFNYREIVIRLKGFLKLQASKIEGSFAGDIIQAVAVEFNRIYAMLFSLREQAYIDSAQGQYLDRLSAIFNIYRKESIKATGIVTFVGNNGTIIPEGTMISSEGMNFKTLEAKAIDGHSADVKAEALSGGSLGNVIAGSISRFTTENIPGVTSLTNKTNFGGGASRESDNDLRNRVYFRIRNPITSGNKYQYEEWAMGYSGVGKAKVFPLWNGPGTVKVSILDDSYNKASQELIDGLKDYLDPSEGKGDGVAPVGAVVTVTTAVEVNIDIKFKLMYKESAEIETVNKSIKKDIEEYLRGIGYSDRQVISYAQIGYIIMTTSGVDDYSALTINSITDNIKLDDERIAKLRGVEINGQLA